MKQSALTHNGTILSFIINIIIIKAAAAILHLCYDHLQPLWLESPEHSEIKGPCDYSSFQI